MWKASDFMLNEFFSWKMLEGGVLEEWRRRETTTHLKHITVKIVIHRRMKMKQTWMALEKTSLWKSIKIFISAIIINLWIIWRGLFGALAGNNQDRREMLLQTWASCCEVNNPRERLLPFAWLFHSFRGEKGEIFFFSRGVQDERTRRKLGLRLLFS